MPLIYSYQINDLAEFKIQSRFAATTKHYKSMNEFKLSSAFIEFRLLSDWIHVSGINVKFKTTKRFKFSVEYSQPRAITLVKRKEFNLYLWFSTETGRSGKHLQISEKPRINIEFRNSVGFEEFLKHFELIKNFFSFCISVPINGNEIEFREHSAKNLKKLGKKFQNTGGLVISDTRTYTKRTTLQDDLMLISYKTLVGREEQLLKKWLELNVMYAPVFKLYFDTLYNPDLYKENAFLNYVSALEIYHRIKNPDFDGKDDMYHRRLNSVLDEIKTLNNRMWVESRLKKRKETRLAKRLESIVNRTPEISKNLAGDTSEFCSKVANTRNYFTHFDQENKKKATIDSKGLYQLTLKMKIYLQVQILMDMGFGESEADELTKKPMGNWIQLNI